MTSLTLPGALADVVAVRPDQDAIVMPEQRVSWAQLDARSRAVAAVLAGRGVTRRTRVGLLMGNGIDWAVVAFAVMRLGAVLVPLSTLLKAPELEQQLRTASVQRLILVDALRHRDFRAEFGELLTSLPNTRLPSLSETWWWDEFSVEDAAPDAVARAAALEKRCRPADDLAIMFTSGSRSTPKGVIHTHGNALRAVSSSLGPRCVRAEERLYIPMPFFWMGGFGGGLLTVLLAGATLLTETEPAPPHTLPFLERERATLFRGWPDQAAALASHPLAASTDLSSLRAGSLAALLPASMQAPPGARSNLFGMTETFGPYCADPLDTDMPEQAWGSCGTPFVGVEVRVVDPESGAVLSAEEHGEIWLRGDHMMRGIVGRAREEVFTVDGWYRTGDLGHLDRDGRLFYHGRSDDMVKVRGASVYPAEVEAALATVAGVHRAFVTDVGDERGTAVGAVVLLDADGVLDVATLAVEAKARLSSFKVPTVWRILPAGADVARTASGKVDKPALQALLAEPS
jgi:acyl-CoA synthetase (AMP-forming)/AMP-acid ligase II